MKKRYCLDTSGLSNPVIVVPPDIFETLWTRICAMIESGMFAVTPAIFAEMEMIRREPLVECIPANRLNLVDPLLNDEGHASQYHAISNRMRAKHARYIAGGHEGSRKSVSVPDMSIVALAKYTCLPLISMEVPRRDSSGRNKSIPDICRTESIEHLTFNDFLRREGVKI